CQHGFGAPYSF
nr:immunoglobulin light chain junction region [Macaca mulatta]